MRNILFRTGLIVSMVLVVSVPAFAQMKIGDSPTSITTGAQLDIEKSGSRTVFMDTGKVGIGDVSPASLLTVGSGDLFQVDSTGNIVKINNVTTSFPSSQGAAGTILTNNGSGTLTWSAPAGISADSLNFTDLSDSLLLDASTDIFSSGTNVLSVTNSGTGNSFLVNDDGTLTDPTPFVVDASGNVGIGTTAPSGGAKFEINGGGTNLITRIYSGNASQFAYLVLGRTGEETEFGVAGAGGQFFSDSSAGSAILKNVSSGNLLLGVGSGNSSMALINGGNVGIGDTTPASMLTVGSGDLFQVNSSGNIVKLNNVTTSFPGSQGAAYSVLKNDGAGTLTWGPSEGIELTRTLPTVVDDIVEIGNFNQSNGGHSIRVSVTVASGGFSTSKSYILNSGYNTTGGAWRIANPITSSMAYSSQDFALDVNSSTTFIYLRLRRTSGSTAGTAYVRIESTGLTTDTFNSSSATGSVTAPTAYYTPLTQDLANTRVGIGTQSPNALLDVNGVLGIANGDFASGGAIRFRKADNSGWDGGMYETNGNILMVHAGASNSVVLRDSSSNYGAWFDFTGNGFTFNNNYDDAASRGALTFYRSRSSATAPAAGFGTFLDFNLEGYTNNTQVGTSRISSIWENTQTNDTTDRDAALTFNTTVDNASAEKMRISSAGNVGVGLTAPSAPLDVKGAADTAGQISLQLRSGNSSANSSSSQVTLGYNNTATYRHAIKSRHDASTQIGNAIDFYLWNYGTDASGTIGTKHAMSINGNGFVGIGTTSPTAKLTISNNVGTAYLDNYSEYQIVTYDGGTAGGSYGQGVIGSTMVFNSAAGAYNFDKGGTSTQMSLDTSGNLIVAGTIKATTFGTSSATTLCHTGNIIALCTSSARYKENIQNLTEGMDIIKKLRPVSFKWKVRDENSVGFIAEDVQKVDPRLTFNNDKGQVEGVHYQLITSYLTKAMQELSVTTDENTADIKALKKENAEMKAEISDLKTRLDRLEEKLK